MKHIRCKLFFSETGECRNGDKCPYSHSKKTPERGRGTTPDRQRAPSRRPSAGQGEKECFQYKKNGSCSRHNCPYKHVDPATPAEGKPKAKAKAEAKSKAEAKPKPKGTAKALPAAPAIRLCRAWNPLAPAIQKRNITYDDDVSECSSLDSDADSDCSTDDEVINKPSLAKGRDRRTQSTTPGTKKKVMFANDVRFQSSKPRRSYRDRGDKIIKVDVEQRFMNNNRINELGFSMHKARLKAQMMSDMLQDDRPGDRHVYVRIPGSDRVREIIFYDGEDELHEYEVGPDERKKVKSFSIVNCMVQPTWIWSKIKFLMDTGCGHDLISQRKVEKHGLETLVSEEAISFQTANGITNTDLISNFQTESFTEPINAYVLDDTPSVLSVGKRCMKQGYGFIWPPGENPFMINPEGKRISLFVNGDIPYVRAGSQKSIAHDDEMAATIKSIREQGKEDNPEKTLNAVAATVDATPGEEGEPDGPAEEYSPDFVPNEAPDEEVPAEEAGRPPDPPDEGDERAHDDDEREIEAEGDGAPTRKAKVGTLKAEAKTLAHLCTHRYRNPYCEACIRAKMKHYRTVRGAFKRELKTWGDLLTFDFLDMRRAADMGVGNDDDMREVLVVRDVATRVIAAIPTMSRYTDDVVEALKRLIGRRKVKLAYSDVAPEFDAAMAQLKIPIDHSLPGLPKNNSLAERTNQEVVNTVATSLLHAGLPSQCWHFALNCVTHNLNIEDVEGDGDSAWKRRTGEDFKGKAIPFVAKVFFKPTSTREKTYAGKFDPKGIPGIFAGYVITTGQQWSRKYKVWDMAEFAGVNLSMNAAVPRKLAQPYLTEVVVLPEDLVFPLKDEYERMNSTLEGLNDNRRLQGKEIKDADDVSPPPSGGDDDDDDDSRKKPPPDPDEIDDGGGAGGIPLDDYYSAVDAIGEKILERDEIDAGAPSALPPSSTLERTDAPIEADEVGPSGRLIPKSGEEDPGEILRCLKDAKLASDDIEHWGVGTKGDG